MASKSNAGGKGTNGEPDQPGKGGGPQGPASRRPSGKATTRATSSTPGQSKPGQSKPGQSKPGQSKPGQGRPSAAAKTSSEPPAPDPRPAPVAGTTTDPTSQGRPAWLSDVLRLAWLPLVLGLVVGVAVAAWSGTSVGHTTDAVINTRVAASQPNERVDLINDLAALPRITSVMEPVAEAANLSPAELRDSLQVTRIEASTMVKVSLTTAEGDDTYRRAVLQDFLDAAQEYLQPSSEPSPALEAAQTAEDDAIDAYYEAIAKNRGIAPDVALSDLQRDLAAAIRAGNQAEVARLNSQMPQAVENATEFAKLTAARERASVNVEAIAQSEAETSSTGPANLRLTYLDNTGGRDGITSSVALRRGLASGVAVVIVVGALVILLGRRRRLATT
ncbi:hypothetical protein [Nocardioides sp. GXZ039]|uniref:hypothetical protein n=1 Tax=Nocardioides sp. GXZ039 TaxID=3136018 RepID=UPI0030F40668